MDSTVLSFALTVCIIGSSATGYVFGLLTNKKKTQDLENKMGQLLENPDCYENERYEYLINNTGKYQVKQKVAYL